MPCSFCSYAMQTMRQVIIRKRGSILNYLLFIQNNGGHRGIGNITFQYCFDTFLHTEKSMILGLRGTISLYM